MTIKVPDHQRALIFQGGGALGAYEVGFYVGKKRSYIDHIRGKFPMLITRIQRAEDPDDIADQAFDFSTKTLVKLFKDGYKDTKKVIQDF